MDRRIWTEVDKASLSLVKPSPNSSYEYAWDITVQAVLLGARWLDRHASGKWWNRIDLSRFDLDEPDRCVCGQVFKQEAKAADEDSGFDFIDNQKSGRWTEAHGFVSPWQQEAWVSVIRLRQLIDGKRTRKPVHA